MLFAELIHKVDFKRRLEKLMLSERPLQCLQKQSNKQLIEQFLQTPTVFCKVPRSHKPLKVEAMSEPELATLFNQSIDENGHGCFYSLLAILQKVIGAKQKDI